MKSKLALASLAILLGAFAAAKLFAQATNPPYMAEFPSVDKVAQAMKTSDPDETAARRMAAFTQLKKMIEDMAGTRAMTKPGPTSDETRMRQDYYTAGLSDGVASTY